MSLVVWVVAPTGRDAELVAGVLRQGGVETAIDDDLSRVGPLVHENAGAVLVAEEALNRAFVQQLRAIVGQQPAWSDLPILILTGTANQSSVQQLEYHKLGIGMPVLLERPIRTENLMSSVQAALRARQRQFDMRDTLRERDRALAELLRSLSSQKQAESALIQSEKLAAVGRLAASISHEINNPLEAVTNLLYLARMERELPERVKMLLNTADEELQRVSQIAAQTLRFHRQSTNARVVRLEELLEPALMLYKGRLLNAQIQVEEQHRGAQPITCFDGDIRQVFNNLIGNALDAMRSGGRLVIRTSNAWMHREQMPGVRISIADTGQGMTPEVRQRIYEPFYTTKGTNGSGLGLWISRGIVEKHFGHLQVRSRVGPASGTVFSLLLPVLHERLSQTGIRQQ